MERCDPGAPRPRCPDPGAGFSLKGEELRLGGSVLFLPVLEEGYECEYFLNGLQNTSTGSHCHIIPIM